MLETPLGAIVVCIDGNAVPYAYETAPREDEHFKELTGRCFIDIDFIPDGHRHTIACLVDAPESPMDDIDVAGSVASKCFYHNNTKLSIAVKGNASDFDASMRDFGACCQFLINGIAYEVQPTAKATRFTFGVAWMIGYTAENEMQTWYGADPIYRETGIASKPWDF